jgi:lipoprotein-releasing system ATP-binding protein
MSLACAGLVKAYPGLEVLRGLDLAVADGETVAIRGASGTGKSTLLQCIGLLDRPDAGEIAIGGQRVDDLRGDRRSLLRARTLGFVFQAFNLLPEFTVTENVLLAARAARSPLAEAGRHAHELLDRVGLGPLRDRDVRTLSGGERQRVALCRALINKPRLLLADEPTGNLDPATATVVLEQMLELARSHGSSVVIVTHDPVVAGRADRSLELREGRLSLLEPTPR